MSRVGASLHSRQPATQELGAGARVSNQDRLTELFRRSRFSYHEELTEFSPGQRVYVINQNCWQQIKDLVSQIDIYELSFMLENIAQSIGRQNPVDPARIPDHLINDFVNAVILELNPEHHNQIGPQTPRVEITALSESELPALPPARDLAVSVSLATKDNDIGKKLARVKGLQGGSSSDKGNNDKGTNAISEIELKTGTKIKALGNKTWKKFLKIKSNRDQVLTILAELQCEQLYREHLEQFPDQEPDDRLLETNKTIPSDLRHLICSRVEGRLPKSSDDWKPINILIIFLEKVGLTLNHGELQEI